MLKIREAKQPTTREFLTLPMLRLKGRFCPQIASSDCISYHQTSDCFEHLSSPALYSSLHSVISLLSPPP